MWHTRNRRDHPPQSPPTTDLVVRVRGLRKSYGDLEAVKGIDLEVPPG